MIFTVFETIAQELTGPDMWLYLAIPITTGLMGWITNIIAIKMTFYPVDFWGYPPYLGWQGVVPRKAVKIAAQFSDLLTENLISIEDLFEKVDPSVVAREMEPAIDDLIEPTLRDTVREQTPTVWELLPGWGRGTLYYEFKRRLPEMIAQLPGERSVSVDDDPEALAIELEESLDESFEDFIDNLMRNHSPTVWESLPAELKNNLLRQIKNDLPDLLSRIIQDWQAKIDDIFDLRTMTVDEISANREILNEVFEKSGHRELTFLKRSGLYFGTFFGIFQMVLWMFYDAWWLLPLAGLFVGLTTNYIAIQLIFSPKEPYKFGPFKLQGLAYKRRTEINRVFSRITTDRVLNVRNIFQHIFEGESRGELFRLLQKRTHSYVDSVGWPFGPLIRSIVGHEKLFDLKNEVSRELMGVLPESVEYSFDSLERQLELEKVLRQNLESLDPHDYEKIMRTPYKEDEWILITVGGMLGLTVGVLQLIYLFGGSLPFI